MSNRSFGLRLRILGTRCCLGSFRVGRQPTVCLSDGMPKSNMGRKTQNIGEKPKLSFSIASNVCTAYAVQSPFRHKIIR